MRVCACVRVCVCAFIQIKKQPIFRNQIGKNMVFVRLLCLYRTAFVIRRKKMFYLTTHSTHFIYGYMTSDIW